jgi:hypothetical protein
MKRRRRSNIEKQEHVVKLLWEFARDLQTKPCTCTDSHGTRVHLDSVGVALREIMDNFGYAVVDVQ